MIAFPPTLPSLHTTPLFFVTLYRRACCCTCCRSLSSLPWLWSCRFTRQCSLPFRATTACTRLSEVARAYPPPPASLHPLAQRRPPPPSERRGRRRRHPNTVIPLNFLPPPPLLPRRRVPPPLPPGLNTLSLHPPPHKKNQSFSTPHPLTFLPQEEAAGANPACECEMRRKERDNACRAHSTPTYSLHLFCSLELFAGAPLLCLEGAPCSEWKRESKMIGPLSLSLSRSARLSLTNAAAGFSV